jgi:hypothetical protein
MQLLPACSSCHFLSSWLLTEGQCYQTQGSLPGIAPYLFFYIMTAATEQL